MLYEHNVVLVAKDDVQTYRSRLEGLLLQTASESGLKSVLRVFVMIKHCKWVNSQSCRLRALRHLIIVLLNVDGVASTSLYLQERATV